MNGEVSRLLKDKSLSSDDKMAFYEDLLARIKSYKSDMEGVKPSQPVIAGPVAAPPADDVPKRDKRSPPKGSVTKRTANKTVGGRVTKIPRVRQTKSKVVKPTPSVAVPKTVVTRIPRVSAVAPSAPKTTAPVPPPPPVRSPVFTRRRATMFTGNGIIRKKKWSFL